MMLPDSSISIELLKNRDIDLILNPLFAVMTTNINSSASTSSSKSFETDSYDSSNSPFTKIEDIERITDDDSHGTNSTFG